MRSVASCPRFYVSSAVDSRTSGFHVSLRDRLGHHIIRSQGPDKRDALGCAERQIEPVHTALTERAPMRAVWANAVIEPASDEVSVGVTAGALSIGEADQRRDAVGVAGQQPYRGAGLALGVLLPQSAARPRQIPRSVLPAWAVSM